MVNEFSQITTLVFLEGLGLSMLKPLHGLVNQSPHVLICVSDCIAKSYWPYQVLYVLRVFNQFKEFEEMQDVVCSPIVFEHIEDPSEGANSSICY